MPVMTHVTVDLATIRGAELEVIGRDHDRGLLTSSYSRVGYIGSTHIEGALLSHHPFGNIVILDVTLELRLVTDARHVDVLLVRTSCR